MFRQIRDADARTPVFDLSCLHVASKQFVDAADEDPFGPFPPVNTTTRTPNFVCGVRSLASVSRDDAV
jgi:hypothetical protein